MTAFANTHLEVINRYLSSEIKKIRGWCMPHLWQAIWPLAREIGKGPIAEIGVLDGKFVIGLVKTFDPACEFHHAAIDIYDRQEFNVDKAGVGRASVVDRNLVAHDIPANSVDKVHADSLTLRQSDAQALVARHGQFKFFSVDGCHEVTHTMHDIEFAMQVTDNTGIIAVDDFMNANWPGVSEAVAKMYLLRNFAFVPLLFTCNKLLLCSLSWHARYLETVHAYVKQHHPETGIKEVTRFGYPTLNLSPRQDKWSNLA